VDSLVAHDGDIESLSKLIQVLTEKELKTRLFVVEEGEIAEADKILPKGRTFPGTMKVHQYVWNRSEPTLIKFRALSCYECSDDCDHFVLGKIDFTPG